MKSLRLLTRRLVQWQRTFPSPASRTLLRQLYRQVYQQVAAQTQQAGRLVRIYLKPKAFLRLICQPRRLRKGASDRVQRPLLLLIAIVSLTSAIGYRFYNEPQLGTDRIAPQTLRAPASARVIDTKTTEMNRKAARVAAVPVLMIDQAANQDIYRSLQRLLERGDELREQAGAFPFIDTSVLSTATQQYLRQTEEWNWRIAIAAIDGVGVTPPVPAPPPVPPAEQNNGSTNASLQVAVIELQNYRRTASLEDFSALTDVILRARERYAATVADLAADKPEEAGFYDVSLLNLTDAEWQKTRATIRTSLEQMLSQGIAPGLPDKILETAIQNQLTDLSPASAPIATRLLMTVLKPNLVQDPVQTKLRAEQAAQAVENVVVEIERGEVIVQAGERITQEDFVLLDYFGLSRRRINWWGLFGFSSLIAAGVTLFWVVERRSHPGLRGRDYCLVLLLTLTAPLVVALNLPSMNLPAIGLLVGSFYGSALGITTVGLLSLILPIGMEVAWTNLLASAAAGLLGAGMAGQLRSREELAMLGGAVGLTQGVVYLVLSLMLSTATTTVWYVVLTTAAVQSLMGLSWSIIALGLSPYMERLFDLVTPIRLAELSNPNRPMLKRLASEAPGTFQHTLFVATLAEAAARALGCNVELVRAGTLYHDIGKMHDPLGFIENQMGGPNKHDEINNPWLSAAIIKKHVSEGLVMARRCRLPKAVQAFIPEHQGTMPISYFYHQALEQAKTDPTLQVDEADFRYSGPIPQSRETGIVMLADSCEAALRSLKDATPEDALAMVNRILRARWQDHQLIDSGLSRAEMGCIAEIFVQVWQQFNHQRIPYPKAALGSQGGSRE
ncbi:HDIG domain-containing protein [Leptolyngbya sp. NK1-12]|uniref:HDIG domain-containing protein n=1 Tax=Leptolyngbya sp. NK1-12 TaxID=2547451 RepID=A0AA96WGJ8_9CYAN|nr:HDIG domain-containing protein [Leptolyngbya sp. NK1-12]